MMDEWQCWTTVLIASMGSILIGWVIGSLAGCNHKECQCDEQS